MKISAFSMKNNFWKTSSEFPNKYYNQQGLTSLVSVASACSSTTCSCPSNWSRAIFNSDSQQDVVCYRKYDKATYENAKATCQAENAYFPRIASDSDVAALEEINTRKFWIQAEYKGLAGSKRWKDWNNKKLTKKNLPWHTDEEGNPEPTKGDIYGYYKDAEIFGGVVETERPFVCIYSILDKCTEFTFETTGLILEDEDLNEDFEENETE